MIFSPNKSCLCTHSYDKVADLSTAPITVLPINIENKEDLLISRLVNITITGKDVTALVCDGNQIVAIEVINNPALTYLDCSNNRLTNLDLSGLVNLFYLKCENNHIENIKCKDVPIKIINC